MPCYVCVYRKSLTEYLPAELVPPLPKKSKQESVGLKFKTNLLLFFLNTARFPGDGKEEDI